MKLTAEKIRAYFDSHQTDFSDAGAESLLEFIYQCYLEFHPIDSKQIRSCFSDLKPFYDALSI